MKKYVTINNKKNTANILLLNIFLYTKSDFIVFDFTMKSLPIIAFYFRWRMLEDSLTFQLPSLAPLKGDKIPEKTRPISKMSINDIISVNFYEIVYVCNKNCEKQKLENKNSGSFYIFLIYFKFYFNFPFPSITF